MIYIQTCDVSEWPCCYIWIFPNVVIINWATMLNGVWKYPQRCVQIWTRNTIEMYHFEWPEAVKIKIVCRILLVDSFAHHSGYFGTEVSIVAMPLLCRFRNCNYDSAILRVHVHKLGNKSHFQAPKIRFRTPRVFPLKHIYITHETRVETRNLLTH